MRYSNDFPEGIAYDDAFLNRESGKYSSNLSAVLTLLSSSRKLVFLT